jgi:hypothetical protein
LSSFESAGSCRTISAPSARRAAIGLAAVIERDPRAHEHLNAFAHRAAPNRNGIR